MATFRSSASFGKRQEFIAVAELLKRGYDVYMTLVDDLQIDCIIRRHVNGELRYLDIQMKLLKTQGHLPQWKFGIQGKTSSLFSIQHKQVLIGSSPL